MAMEVEELIQTIQQLPRPEKEYVIESVLKSMQAESEIQDLADLRARYPDEWLAVMVPDGEDRYNPQRGRLVAHSPDRSLVWQHVAELPASADVYVFFNGPVAAKGFGIIFHDTTGYVLPETLPAGTGCTPPIVGAGHQLTGTSLRATDH